MFSTKLSRAAHRATTSHTAAAAITATSSTVCATCASPHQRRPSSSKASRAPDHNAAKPAPAAKSDGTEARDTPVSGRTAQPKSSKGRTTGGYRRVGQASNGNAASKKATAEPVDQFAGLPSVPSLQGLDAKVVADLSISAFFSMHRPISVTSSIPPTTTTETFNTLFTSQQQRQGADNPWENGNSAERRPEDVIYTLHNTIEALEAGTRNAEDDGVRWEVIHESPTNSDGVKHLDGMPKMKSLDELVSQFRPFKAPPPPQPFPESNQAKASDKKAAQKTSIRGRPRQKTFTTTITVTESTDEDGQKSYSASSSPIVRLPDTGEQSNQDPFSIREPRTRQPFLTRMYRRRLARVPAAPTSYREPREGMVPFARRAPSDARQERIQNMFLISVKRQRKLKMKKHKYKKLMKRTRNLRRRLERN